MPELMPRISLGKRLCALGNPVAGEHRPSVIAVQRLVVQPKGCRQLFVKNNQLRDRTGVGFCLVKNNCGSRA